jgi:putative hydrolase of the HAD superfamily
MGTLIGLKTSVGCTYARLAASHGIAIDPDALDRVLPTILRQAPPLAFPGLRGDALLEAERRWWGDRINESFGAVGAPAAPQSLQAELFEHYAEPAAWKVYADVPGPLRTWREAGLQLAVVSNFDSRLHRVLEGLELMSWIDGVVVSSSAGNAKPSPEPFHLALELLQVSPADAWHVGDSEEDARGAEAAGIRCLIVRRH